MDKQKDLIKEISSYKGIIFDVDETIINLGVDWGVLKETLSNYWYKKTKERIVFSPLDEKLITTKKLFGENLYYELINIISDFEMDTSHHKPNWNLINYINQTEQKIALYSMNTKKCINFLIHTYFNKIPDIVVTKNNCIKPKPAKEDILRILKFWQLNPKDVIYIGNSNYDKISGEMASIKTIIIPKI